MDEKQVRSWVYFRYIYWATWGLLSGLVFGLFSFTTSGLQASILTFGLGVAVWMYYKLYEYDEALEKWITSPNKRVQNAKASASFI